MLFAVPRKGLEMISSSQDESIFKHMRWLINKKNIQPSKHLQINKTNSSDDCDCEGGRVVRGPEGQGQQMEKWNGSASVRLVMWASQAEVEDFSAQVEVAPL